MKIKRLKKRYLEVRFGHQMIGPVIQLANFLMIAYLAINEVIPIYIFAPKAREAGKTVYIMMKQLDSISNHIGLETPVDFKERMKYVRKIGDGEL
jgi:hypothetical protein